MNAPDKESLVQYSHGLQTAWLACVLAPLPFMLFWPGHDGRAYALVCFCASCFSLVAYAFRPRQTSARSWWQQMRVVATALLLAWIAFSLLWLVVVDASDFVAVFIGFQILIPSICIVPWMTLKTRKPFASVVLSGFLLFGMKCLAGIVTNLRYGWGDGNHDMPWTEPNMMLTSFWIAAAALCAVCFALGARKFQGPTELPSA